MSYTLSVPERLLTWLDVERVLKQKTHLWTCLPAGIQTVDCYQDGMDISYSGEQSAVQQWLVSIFGKSLLATESKLALRAGAGKYPINLESVTEQSRQRLLPLYPLWREVTYLQDATTEAASPLISWPSDFADSPQMVSFHSFKGGVGRTTALMTYAIARLYAQTGDKPTKVLVVDADLEAPGVTFWLEEKNRPQVSFLQFLEAMHYPPVSEEASLDFFADELRKTSLNLDGPQRELFVLPAALNLADILDMPVQPGHLARNPANPWILTDHLYQLGKRLGVDAIFIDLRAGLSELASPLIFDPRVEHYFVTTVARQSVKGICEVLHNLHTFNNALPHEKRRGAKPSVIVSLLTTDLRRAPDYTRAKENIERAYPPTDESLDEGVEWLEVDFWPSLMSISSIDEAIDLLKQSSLYLNSAQTWATNAAESCHPPEPLSTESVRGASAQALFQVCEKEYAEHSGTTDWLVTDPLRNLGKHYTKDTPNAVLVGAKGAGKTFTYLQICRAQTWQKYLDRVAETESSAEHVSRSFIFPVLWSSNVEGESKSAVAEAQKHAITSTGIQEQNMQLSDVRRKIQANLDTQSQHWDDFWEGLVCASLGSQTDNLKNLNQYLLAQKCSVILLFDGLEDIFSDPSNPNENKAIESLLTLVNRLGELSDQRIGALVFARADYVQAAIKQNLGQFLSRFSAFQLTWDPESFLRLAYWLCAKAEVIGATIEKAQKLPINSLIEELIKLWGKKLGKDSSKEGHSARWVYAALCDLTGSFQARDLVRFFKFAAREEIQNKYPSWADRILSPESMRNAIRACSDEKVKEARLEIKPLRDWIIRMESERITDRPIPFSATSVLLKPEELVALRELGVVYEDIDPVLGDKRLFLPEIYRSGLGFDLSGGRPKIQALLKKNLGKMPF